MRRVRKPALDRFLAKVDRSEDGCWRWTGSLRAGYGLFRDEDGRITGAHRWYYEHANGAVPEPLVLDHLCRNRECVNPAHLEPVTRKENALRGVGVGALNAKKTHCPHGHEYTPENIHIGSSGSRWCRACWSRPDLRERQNERRRERYRERKEAAA